MNLNNLDILPERDGFYLAINPRGMGLIYSHTCKEKHIWFTVNTSKSIALYKLEKNPKASWFSEVKFYNTQADYRWFNQKVNITEKVICNECKEKLS